MSKGYLLTSWLFFFTVQLFAQQLHWTNFRLPNNLNDAQPRAIFESRNGLVWLVTSKGVSAFDGTSFTDLTRRDSLPADARTVFEDHQNTLWVGYADGSVDRFLNGQLAPWEPEEGHPAAAITGFAEDDTNNLWIATYGEGAYVVGGRYLYNFNTDDGLPGNDVYSIARLPDGEIWLGTDGGISICTFNAGKKSVRNLTRADGLPDEIVRLLLPDNAGNCWIGTHDKGVVHYNRTSGIFTTPVENWPYGPINDLVVVENRELIIATEDNGVWRLNLDNNQLEQLSLLTSGAKSTKKVQDLLQDAEGGLWCLSNQDGLFRANQKLAFVTAGDREIQAVFLDRTGKLWAGTNRGLLSLSLTGELLPYPPAKELNIVSVFEDRFGNLWLGTFGDGAYIVNPTTGNRRHLGQREGLLNGSILSIDGEGDRIWLASLGGVTEVDLLSDPLLNTPLSFRKVEGLKTDFIYQLIAGRNDRVWFATDGEGLAVLDRGVVTHLRHTQTVAGESVDLRRVYSLASTIDGHIWFNTAREGLFELVNDSLYTRGLSKALSGDNITALAPAGPSQLIMSHNEGLTLLSLPSGSHQNIYDSQNGGPTYRPILNSVATGPGGRVWFGCSGGLIRYRDLPQATAERPRVVLRSASIYPATEPQPNGKRFAYDENTLAFDFLGLWYTAPEKVRCRYQLEGYDPGWIETRNQRVIYSKLAPGNYTFRVTAAAGEDWAGASVVTYTFSIAPPLWQRWWFILTALLLVLLVGSYLIRRRDRQLRHEAYLQKQRIESHYEELKSQINPHFLFNSFNTLVAMIEETPADAVTYTEKLSDLFRNILHYRDRETIPISEELDLLEDYLFLLDKRFGNKLRVNVDLSGSSGYIVPLSLQLLVENAIKHNVVSAGQPLSISVTPNENGRYVCVQNPRQQKLRKEPSTGFGLQSLSERYALLTSREVVVEDTKETFRVCIPVIPSPSTKVNN